MGNRQIVRVARLNAADAPSDEARLSPAERIEMVALLSDQLCHCSVAPMLNQDYQVEYLVAAELAP